MKPRRRIPTPLVCLALLASLPLAGCGRAGADTPEACCERVKTAIEQKDVGGFYDCLTPESQDVVVGSMVLMKLASAMGAAMGGPEAASDFADIDAVLEKHNVTDEAMKEQASGETGPGDPNSVKKLAALVDDKRAFVADMFAVMEKVGDAPPDFREKLTGELKDVQINGDRATGKLTTATGEEELDFRKLPDGWRLHIDVAKQKGALAAPPAGSAE